MNTLESAFKDWLNRMGIQPAEPSMADLSAAFNSGYLAGFDHAKHEALTALENALGQKVTDD